MDKTVIQDLTDSTVEVFSRMIKIDLAVKPTEKNKDVIQQCQIMGMVGLAGRSMGIVSVHCSSRMGMIIASKMLAAEITEVGEEVKDAVGEVTNMVAGSFKTKRSRAGARFDLSVPTVIVGENYTTKTIPDAPFVVLECSCQDETVYVKLNFQG